MKAFRNTVQKLVLPIILLACVVGASCMSVPYTKKNYPPGVMSAVFSPTDAHIAVGFFSPQDGGILLMTRQGKVLRWLRQEHGEQRYIYPSFSPDGQKIAFVSLEMDSGDRGDIYIMDKDGKNVRQLTSNSDHDRNPRFSPDGSRIYFLRHDSWGIFPRYSSSGSYDSDVYYVNLQDGKVHQVTHQEYRRLYDLSVFPDGKHILIRTSKYLKEGYALWKINIANPAQISPIEPDMGKFTPDPKIHILDRYHFVDVKEVILSRDGSFLAFDWQNPLYSHFKNWIGQQVCIADMNNMQTSKLTSFKKGAVLSDISPDNEHVLFTTSSDMDHSDCCYFKKTNLWIVNHDGNGLRNISLDFTGVMKQGAPYTKRNKSNK